MDKPLVVLLHGGGVGPWSMQSIIAQLEKQYEVFAPCIEGHSARYNEPFKSIEASASALIQTLETKFDKPVFAIAGLSLGAQIVIEMLCQKPDICKHVLIESGLVIPMPWMTSIMSPTYKWLYPLLKKRWFSKWQAKALCVKADDFETYFEESQKMQLETLINMSRSNGLYALKPSIGAYKGHCVIIVGEREPKVMIQSADQLEHRIPGSQKMVLPHFSHGELSLKNPDQYVAIFKKMCEGQ